MMCAGNSNGNGRKLLQSLSALYASLASPSTYYDPSAYDFTAIPPVAAPSEANSGT